MRYNLIEIAGVTQHGLENLRKYVDYYQQLSDKEEIDIAIEEIVNSMI
jgi:hypothetical protein